MVALVSQILCLVHLDANDFDLLKLLLSLSTATDPLEVPVLREDMKKIWVERKHHARCLQDPPNTQLYHELFNEGRCQTSCFSLRQGSTSLEKFHLYMLRFISGLCANAVNFQTYLLDDITHWNINEASQALQPALWD